jgi:DNA-binding IclR family transcriptional regulator
MAARVQSVERAAAILQVLAAESQPTSLAHLAATLGLAKGTTHGLVQTLRDVGFVDQDPESGLYSVGTGLQDLGATDLDHNELRARALNWTDALAGRTGQAVLVGVRDGDRLVVVHHVFAADPGPQTLLTGQRRPLHATALGKVLLAHAPHALRRVAGQELESFTFRTVTDPALLQRELADVRDHGWAAVVEELEPGSAGLAAPIRDPSGFVVAAVGIEGSLDAVCDERRRPRPPLVSRVVAAGRSISRELGHGRQ